LSNIEELITDMKESLEREIQAGFAEVNTRLDRQALRLDRQGSNWQTGRRWSSRMDDWAEKVDAALETKDREIGDLRKRLSNLENRLPPQA
jgi:hypothetical protein